MKSKNHKYKTLRWQQFNRFLYLFFLSFQIVRPVSAFLVVDVQNDFIDGPLAIKNGPAGEDGAEVISPINEVMSH